MKRILITVAAVVALIGAGSSAGHASSADAESVTEAEIIEIVEMARDLPYLANPFDGMSEAPPTTFEAALTECKLKPNSPGVELGDGGYTLTLKLIDPNGTPSGVRTEQSSCLGDALEIPLRIKSHISHNSSPLDGGGFKSWDNFDVEWSASLEPEPTLLMTFYENTD